MYAHSKMYSSNEGWRLKSLARVVVKYIDLTFCSCLWNLFTVVLVTYSSFFSSNTVHCSGSALCSRYFKINLWGNALKKRLCHQSRRKDFSYKIHFHSTIFLRCPSVPVERLGGLLLGHTWCRCHTNRTPLPRTPRAVNVCCLFNPSFPAF